MTIQPLDSFINSPPLEPKTGKVALKNPTSGTTVSISYPIPQKDVQDRAAVADAKASPLINKGVNPVDTKLDGRVKMLKPSDVEDITPEQQKMMLTTINHDEERTEMPKTTLRPQALETTPKEGGEQNLAEQPAGTEASSESKVKTEDVEKQEVEGWENISFDNFISTPVTSQVSNALSQATLDSAPVIEQVSSSPETATPERNQQAVVAIAASYIEASTLNVPSPHGTVVKANDHPIFVNTNLVVVGDVKASEGEEAKQEIHETLTAALDSPQISDDTKKNITTNREQGRVTMLDPARTGIAMEQALSNAEETLMKMTQTLPTAQATKSVNLERIEMTQGQPTYRGEATQVQMNQQLERTEEEEKANQKREAKVNFLTARRKELHAKWGDRATPNATVLGEMRGFEKVVEQNNLKGHPKLSSDVPTQALPNGLEIYKLSEKRWLLNVYVPTRELISAIQISSCSPPEKQEYLDAIKNGLLQIPTRADMEESKKVEARFVLELTSWLDTQLEKLQKKEEKKKQNLETATPTKGEVASSKVREEQLDELAQLLVEKIAPSLRSLRRQLEKFYLEMRQEKHHDFEEELKALENLAKLLIKYYLKEDLKLFLKNSDFTGEELKRKVDKWLQAKTKTTIEETEGNG